MITHYHAKYFAYELTKRCASDSVEKLAAALADAQVDLNPHQVEAALFAFRSPFSRARSWPTRSASERRSRPGCCLPRSGPSASGACWSSSPPTCASSGARSWPTSSTCHPRFWKTEASTRPSEPATSTRSSRDAIVLCSYQFARTKEPYLRQTPWDLVVIDEAHRLRNVYKTTSKIAIAIKQAVAPFPKVLLTATPLQNSLLELYGLVSIIDDFAFGDLKSLPRAVRASWRTRPTSRS